jgi:hypothetical protein
VLRLSSIYALLDCTTKISPAHHRAALALWNYCNRSAQWIFKTTTGYSNADRILIALRAAGGKGLTQTEISKCVFNKNAPSGAIAEALRILQQSKLAKFEMESTCGAPRTKWFATNRV